MSTYFAIKLDNTQEEIEVAFRHGIGKGKVQITILNPIVYLIEPETEVIPIDNSHQGIYTVKDLLSQEIVANDY